MTNLATGTITTGTITTGTITTGTMTTGTMTTGTMTARQLMTTDLPSVSEEMSVRNLADFFLENDISGAVVHDGEGHPCGVVTSTDIAAHAGDSSQVRQHPTDPLYYMRGWDEIREASEAVGWQIENVDLMVRDIMNPTIFSVDENTPLAQVADEMLERHIHRILVTREKELVGVITSSDFVRLYATQAAQDY